MSFRSLTYSVLRFQSSVFFFFFNDTATTEIYTLSLHDALPISHAARWRGAHHGLPAPGRLSADRLHRPGHGKLPDRKSTRLNSSHLVISYAVFCLKKKNKANTTNSSCCPTRLSHM